MMMGVSKNALAPKFPLEEASKMKSNVLRQVSELCEQLKQDGLTLALCRAKDGQELDLEETMAQVEAAEALGDQLGCEVSFTPKGKSPKAGKKMSGPAKYARAIKRIMNSESCDRKEAKRIYDERKKSIRLGQSPAAKKRNKKAHHMTVYWEKVRAYAEDNSCSIREAQKAVKAMQEKSEAA